jgi:hypothetical protein
VLRLSACTPTSNGKMESSIWRARCAAHAYIVNSASLTMARRSSSARAAVVPRTGRGRLGGQLARPAAARSQQRCRQTDRRRAYPRIFRCVAPALRSSVIMRNTRQIHRDERRHQFASLASSRTERKQSRSRQTTEAPEKGKEAARKELRGSKEGSFTPYAPLVLTAGTAARLISR